MLDAFWMSISQMFVAFLQLGSAFVFILFTINIVKEFKS